MKKAVSLLLSAVLLLALLPACQEPVAETDPPDDTQWPAALDVVNAVFPASGFDESSTDVEYLSVEDDAEFLADYLENAYGLAEGQWEDAAVIRATGASAFELAVLRLEDESAATRAATELMTYIFNRQGDFAGYAPAEANMVALGSINQDGPYAALFICPDTAGADAAFAAAVNGKALPNQPVGERTVEADVNAILHFLYERCSNMLSDDSVEWLDGSDPDALSGYIRSSYGLPRGQWEEAAVVHGTGALAFELAVLRLQGEDEVWDVMDVLSMYLDLRELQFAEDAEAAALLDQAAVYSASVDSGEACYVIVIMLACEDPELVVGELAEALQPDYIGRVERHVGYDSQSEVPGYDSDYPDRIEFSQPNKDDMSIYDTSAILAAWEAEDPSGLSSYDRDIYDAAKKVLDKQLKNGMSDLQKETAIYSWVVNNVDYDWTHQDVMAETPRESFTPYGGLVNHTAVCLGYATTFQLLCNLAGVECITVAGAAFSSQEDHGWNMVRLDGNWYCVDCTWDANYREAGISRGRERDWDYFNVTSDEMAATDHQWDYANTPEAVTER